MMCKPGSVGDLGGQPPRSTRPAKPQADEQVRLHGPLEEDAPGTVPHPADVADSEPADQNSTGPRTFDFLGFTHYWGRSRRGGWVVKGETAMGRGDRAVWTCCRLWAGRTYTCRLVINTSGSRECWKAITGSRGGRQLLCPPPEISGCRPQVRGSRVVSAWPGQTVGVTGVREGGAGVPSSRRTVRATT